MALPPLATVSDLAAWVGQEIPDFDQRAGAVLSAASALVRSYTGETWMDAEGVSVADVPDAVGAVVVQVAARFWFNPATLSSVTADDGTRRWGNVGSHLTDADKDALAPFVSNPTSGLSTLGLTRGHLGDSTIYVPTGPPPSGPPFPWYADGDLL